jgi:hypothetical protein
MYFAFKHLLCAKTVSRARLLASLPLLFCFLAVAPALHAQVTATVSGTVTDPKGALIVGAKVTVIDEATGDVRASVTNKQGVYSVPNLNPSTYTVKVAAPGFAPKEITGIELHSDDVIKVPTFALAIGRVTDSVTVTSVAGQIMEVENGMRSETLTYSDVQDLALTGRDTTELLKVLPGVVQVGNNGYNALSTTTGNSAIGNGMGINGAPYKGGTAINMDGASILDIGDDFSGLATINPEMTQEVQVTTSAFGADTANGPNVINATGRSGGDRYHGEAYFDGRNDALNANDWQDNHVGKPRAGAAYYYPGASISGPVPYTHKKLFFFGAFELPYQNQGNANIIKTYVPTPAMLRGDFSTDDAANNVLCPAGFSNANGGTNTPTGFSVPGVTGVYGQGAWCQNIASNSGFATILRDGTQITPVTNGAAAQPGFGQGGIIPQAYIDQNMLDIAKVWPAFTSPFIATTTAQIVANGGYNFYEPIINHDNGWVAHGRIDFDWNENNKFYISYQQSYDSQLASNCGSSFYGGCGTSLQYPGGGITKKTFSKVVNGHYTHIFSPTLTNEALASWVWGNIPIVPVNPSADYRSTLGINIACIYCANPKYAPTFGTSNGAYPGIGQADDWEPGNYYIVEKSVPTFADNLTKVWGNHTLKFGAMTSNTDNYQGNQSTNLQGTLTIGGNPGTYKNYFATQNTCAVSVCGGYTGNVGSYNPTANLVTGNLTSYGESNSSPLSDVAYQTIAVYADDQIKVNKNLSLQVGFRFEHIGWWYDRQGTGLAVFYANRVLPDFYAGKYAPGFYWHGIDSGIPLSGRPNRFGFVSPRFGLSYDVFGTGKTLVRGGWGAYRYQEAANGPQAALNTAQGVQNFAASNFTATNTSFLVSQIGQLKSLVPYCYSECSQNAQTGYSPNDYGLPLTYSYNFTIDQKLPWKMLLDVAYVGNRATHLSDNGQDGTSSGNYDNQNKTPLGAYFAADPSTGVVACNPEKLNAVCSAANNAYDYQPYGRLTNITGCANGNNPSCLIYGTNSVTMIQNLDYQNYNAVQVSINKRSGPITLNANFTWSKSLGTVANYDAFHIAPNNTYDNLNRPLIFNSSYIYREPNFFHGNKIIGGAINGWTLSGITLWQQGVQTIPTISIQYDPATIPGAGNQYSINTGSLGVGSSTFFGTNATINTARPNIISGCNPKSGLATHQLYRPCFTATPFGQVGGQALPFVAGQAFLENDLAIYKTFTVHEQHKIQFRLSAFNWLNHPLPTYASSGESTTEYYYYNYQTHGISANATCPGTAAPGSCNPSGAPYLASTSYSAAGQDPATLFGQQHYKLGFGGNSQRILEFDVKYTF